MTDLPVGALVAVHWNLHRWSCKAVDGPNRGRVVANVPALTLADVVWKVSEAGRQRVIARGQRSVHAWAHGRVVPTPAPEIIGSGPWSEVSYNPFRAAYFHTRDGLPVFTSSLVVFRDRHRQSLVLALTE